MTPDDPSRRPRALLLAGMLAGMAAAVWTLVSGGGPGGLPSDAVARVNERLITREAWLRAVAAVASDRRTPLTEADRRHILDRLIDEELLVQHGMGLGLVEQDRRLRGQLVSEVVAAAAASAPEPDDATIERFYAENRDYFATAGRLRVTAERADGQPFSPPVPDALLPPAKLREYLGPTLTQLALALEPGQAGPPRADGVVVRVLEKEPARVPELSEIREEVRAAMRRRAEEEGLRRLLDDLRDDGNVVVRRQLE